MGKKKSCYGCRALDHVSTRFRCELGYRIKKVRSVATSTPTPIPINSNCPKPKTYGELCRLLDEKEAKEMSSG